MSEMGIVVGKGSCLPMWIPHHCLLDDIVEATSYKSCSSSGIGIGIGMEWRIGCRCVAPGLGWDGLVWVRCGDDRRRCCRWSGLE